MADVLDEDLELGLKQAKKKPRNFALVIKGSKALKLIVQKKPIKAGEVQAAKAEAKGTGFYKGVCQGDGGLEMVFKLVGEEPSVKTVQFKELIAEQTGLTIKPRFELVSELAEVDDEAEESEGSEVSSEDAPLPPTAPPPPPTGEQPQDAEAAIKKLMAAMNQLSAPIKAAVAANPARRDEVVGLVGKFQQQAKDKQVDLAKATLLALGKIVKELADGGAGGAPPTAPPTSTAPPTAPPPTAPTGTTHGETRAPAGDFPKLWAAAKQAWIDATDTVDAQISKLQSKLLAEDDKTLKGIAEFGLNAVTKNLKVPLLTAIRNVDGASNPESRAKEVAAAKKTVDQFQKHIETDEAVLVIDQNPFQVPVTIRQSMGGALTQLAQALSAA